jgi:hypothetical protein
LYHHHHDISDDAPPPSATPPLLFLEPVKQQQAAEGGGGGETEEFLPHEQSRMSATVKVAAAGGMGAEFLERKEDFLGGEKADFLGGKLGEEFLASPEEEDDQGEDKAGRSFLIPDMCSLSL